MTLEVRAETLRIASAFLYRLRTEDGRYYGDSALAEALYIIVQGGHVTTDDLRSAFDRAILDWEL